MDFNYPESLPVSQKRQDILKALTAHQVIIVAGDTGSGKTTQLPKMCLELLLTSGGRVGCTQPRRIAALTVSARVADELEQYRQVVGYKIRFRDSTSDATRIKFMTDGVLLAESRNDRLLQEYDFLIIDEAHERSLNIDFLLGHLKNICNERPDLKIIITSATIDTDAFSKHFNNAPIVQIPGKTYPVEVRYCPPLPDKYGEIENYIESCVDAISQIYSHEPPGDILAFLPSERDIRNCVDLLKKKIKNAAILPLFGRLHSADQKKIFHSGKQTKIVIATNVAETSITVPGIRYVVDTGLARMAFYNFRAKTNSLPIQRISRASCDQRKGRCGRIGPGICIRLFDEQDYLDREEYTLPEIKRSNLAEVILQMLSFDLGDPFTFPFIDPPQSSAINEGFNQLQELGAIDHNRTLTANGRKMARMPIDPRISRIVIEANTNNCLREIMIIATVLAIQDPRVRPADFEQQADSAHEQFLHKHSDFLTYLNIWNRFHAVKGKTSWSRLKKFCHGHYLSFQRMREWIDLHSQMNRILQSFSHFTINEQDASYDDIHKSLASGFLRNIAMKKTNTLYLGASGKELMVFPGSGQFKTGSPWIVASSFLETNRLYALNVASIQPEWLEALGGNLCRYSWSNPRYHKKSGRIVADEKVSLFGLPIIPSRKVNFGNTNEANRKIARDIFIQQALVEGNLTGNYLFLEANIKLLTSWTDIEDRLRARDILVHDEVIFQFYNEKLPETVFDRFSLNRFLQKKRNKTILTLSEDDIVTRKPSGSELADFPSSLQVGSHSFRLEYTFDPASDRDGVTVRIPVALADTLRPEIFEWLVPGLLQEKITFLLKGLPKRIRRHLVPINIAVDKILDDVDIYKGSFFGALESSLHKHFQITVKKSDWPEQLPKHLQMCFLLYDISGKEFLCSRDFSQLLARKKIDSPVSKKNASREDRHTIEEWKKLETRTWDFDCLPTEIPLFTKEDEIAGYLYPAITPLPEKAMVTLRFLPDRSTAISQNQKGLRFLYRLHFTQQYALLKKYCNTSLSGPSSLWFFEVFATKDIGIQSMLDFIMDTLFKNHDGKIPTLQIFQKNIDAIKKTSLFSAGRDISDKILSLLRLRREVQNEISRHKKLASQSRILIGERYVEYQERLEEIIPPDFLQIRTLLDFEDCERYLKSLIIRINRAHADPAKDEKKAAVIAPYEKNLTLVKDKKQGASQQLATMIGEYEKLLQEMRVSLFSPEIKTAVPVSEKRLKLLWRKIELEY
ncbi:MAG: ATP-dependent RNA helicase HrpA [Desulfopila sp.]|jgi:ATP-dependent helicase HrpA|nr:ATP-dependent RNA helicase HrpA [Desulfopila sp.]